MKHKKEFIIGTIGIFMIVLGLFLTSSALYEDVNKKEDENSLEEEQLKVGDELIDLKTYRVDQSFFINMPNSFITLDEATLKANYPNNDRPELVFQNTDNTTHVFVTTTNIAMADTDLQAYLDQQVQSLQEGTIESGLYTSNDKTFARWERRDQDPAGYYRDTRYFTFDDKLVIVEFNTLLTQEEEWKDVKDAILDSISFTEEQAKNNL